jgi:hypothetical protein
MTLRRDSYVPHRKRDLPQSQQEYSSSESIELEGRKEGRKEKKERRGKRQKEGRKEKEGKE